MRCDPGRILPPTETEIETHQSTRLQWKNLIIDWRNEGISQLTFNGWLLLLAPLEEEEEQVLGKAGGGGDFEAMLDRPACRS